MICIFVNSEILAEIRRLNKAGFKDAAIAATLGLNYSTVRYNRIKMRLPLNTGSYTDRRIKRYCVYDAKTTEFIFEGTAKECAAKLGIPVGYFHQLATYFRDGLPRKWEIYYAENLDMEDDVE